MPFLLLSYFGHNFLLRNLIDTPFSLMRSYSEFYNLYIWRFIQIPDKSILWLATTSNLCAAMLIFNQKLPESIQMSFFSLQPLLDTCIHFIHALGLCSSLLGCDLVVFYGVFLISGLEMDGDLFFDPFSCAFPLSTFLLTSNPSCLVTLGLQNGLVAYKYHAMPSFHA